MRIIPIECIKDGSILGRTLFDNDGKVLLKEGVTLSTPILKRLKYLGINYLYIVDKYSCTELEDIVKPELRQKAINLIKSTFNSFICSDSSNLNIHPNFEDILNIAEQLIEDILSKDNIIVNLIDIKSLDNYTYQHSVNVAVLSLVIGIKLNLSKVNLTNLCVGALLHDIGKIFIPNDILNKPSSLNEDEFKIIQEHSLKGYHYLRYIQELPLALRLIVLEHHEKIDGSGYPYNKTGDKISYLSKIVSIADVYDALTSNRPYRQPLMPSEALEFILGNAGSHFDFDLVKSFSSTIIPYPNGTLVELNTGDICIVKENFNEFPLRPNIEIIKSSDTNKIGDHLDLRENLSLVIEKMVFNP